MVTYSEFIQIAERYYQPDEPLQSGKTPYGKAVSSTYRQKGEFKRSSPDKKTPDAESRIERQRRNTYSKVKHGADNPNFNLTPDSNYDVKGKGGDNLEVTDTKRGYSMQLSRLNSTVMGKPEYDVTWTNKNRRRDGANPGKSRRVVRDITRMWKQQVSPRLPYNSVLSNYPQFNDTSDRNTRAKFYSKYAGFGDMADFDSAQYAKVEREPSSRQAAKGVLRTKPIDARAAEDSIVDLSSKIRARLDATRQHKPIPRQTEPRKIAPAKPSRPSIISPPIRSSVQRFRPITPKLRGRLALAGAALTGAGALYDLMRSKRKKPFGESVVLRALRSARNIRRLSSLLPGPRSTGYKKQLTVGPSKSIVGLERQRKDSSTRAAFRRAGMNRSQEGGNRIRFNSTDEKNKFSKTAISSYPSQSSYALDMIPDKVKERMYGNGVRSTQERSLYLRRLRRQLGGSRTRRGVHNVDILPRGSYMKNDPKELVSRGKEYNRVVRELPQEVKNVGGNRGDKIVGKASEVMIGATDTEKGRRKRRDLYSRALGASSWDPITRVQVASIREELMY
jgi:hypothetical protein